MYTIQQIKIEVAKLQEKFCDIFAEEHEDDIAVREWNSSTSSQFSTAWNAVGENFKTTHDWSGRNFYISSPIVTADYVHSSSKEETRAFIEEIKAKRNQLIVWIAFFHAVSDLRDELCNDITTRVDGMAMNWKNIIVTPRYSETPDVQQTNMFKALQLIQDAKVQKEHLQKGIARYKDILVNAEYRLNDYNMEPQKAANGLQNVLRAAVNIGKEAIEAQIQGAIKALPANGQAARTWGFEVEVPDAKGVEAPSGSGIEKGTDGSLRSYEANDDCECDCRECTYHECNCDDCESYNDSPEHCGDSDCATADSAEYRTTGGIPRLHHTGLYELCERLNNEDAEMNDSAGTHIHVYAQDLTTNQVGQVLAMYKMCENVLSVIAGRRDVNYAKDVVYADVARAIRKKNPNLRAVKQMAVNVSQLFTSRGTIEFRQMDCNLNADRITFWAWLVRGFVTTAQRGATFIDYKNVDDLNKIIEVLAKYGYTMHDETPGNVIPGSKNDLWAWNSTRVLHKQA